MRAPNPFSRMNFRPPLWRESRVGLAAAPRSRAPAPPGLVRPRPPAGGPLGPPGAPALFTRGCLAGDCCAEFWEQYGEPMPRGVVFVSVYSRSDGIVDWQPFLDRGAEHVEVQASHIGMAV